MTMIAQFFLILLKLGIGTVPILDSVKHLLSLSMHEWREVMALAERQGVLSIVVDGLHVLIEIHKGEIVAQNETPAEWQLWLLENIGQSTQYEMLNHKQKKVLAELSEIWAAEGILMMVFKGQANAALYPKPEHRAVGDIDCWLFGDAGKGDEIAKAQGAEVSFDWYRHSKIAYKEETIENHRVMSHTRGNKKKRKMENELRSMLHTKDLAIINGCGNALMPSPQFNACFLTYHGLHHFLSEGLRMKQILDWAMFLKKEQDKVEWKQYNHFCKRYKLDRFAAVMNYIASEYLGVQLNSSDIKVDGTFAEKIMCSTLYDDDYLFNSGKSDWTVRWLLVKNMLKRDKWKYRDIGQQNVWMHLWQNVVGFISNED